MSHNQRPNDDPSAALIASRDQFLRLVTHELRTPVSIALVWAHLLREKRVPTERIDEALAAIEESARTQKRLVDHLGDAARISSGRVDLDRQPTDLRATLLEGLELIASDAESHGVVLRSAIDELGEYSLDADRFRQAFGELLTNALRHTQRGDTITVQAHREPHSIRISVADSGTGIHPELRPLLFDPAMHAKREELRAAQAAQGGSPLGVAHGLGLGLMIAQRLIALHGGTLTAASDGPGRGATFLIELPT